MWSHANSMTVGEAAVLCVTHRRSAGDEGSRRAIQLLHQRVDLLLLHLALVLHVRCVLHLARTPPPHLSNCRGGLVVLQGCFSLERGRELCIHAEPGTAYREVLALGGHQALPRVAGQHHAAVEKMPGGVKVRSSTVAVTAVPVANPVQHTRTHRCLQRVRKARCAGRGTAWKGSAGVSGVDRRTSEGLKGIPGAPSRMVP